jgi:Nucleotidyl transferase AbiEii toxin, Type IV TA system
MSAGDRHGTSLATSTDLYRVFAREFITPLQVITVLNQARVRFVLIGGYSIGGWVHEPRATQDVDVLVATRNRGKAVTALQKAFPRLVREDHEEVVRLRDPEAKRVVIDVHKPAEPLGRAALRNTQPVTAEGQTYQIPTLGMALALKFAAMMSLRHTDDKKYLHAHDFIGMVKANPTIDLDKLAGFGELIYPGGGRDISEKVRQVRAGEKLRL